LQNRKFKETHIHGIPGMAYIQFLQMLLLLLLLLLIMKFKETHTGIPLSIEPPRLLLLPYYSRLDSRPPQPGP
jgi:hypothetical protein